ncbi:MAG TPA: hypothetical protein H9879_07225 [Candidatus Alistipes intestinipullorum]|nr:hypothetical protein [Candidatus Alistipes intestinipullorum]
MDFISAPLVVGMITLGIYKFFELLVCRRERLNIIEKIDPGALVDYLKNVRMGLPLNSPASNSRSGFSSWALRLGCLLAGLGLGLLVAYWTVDVSMENYYAQTAVYGGSVLCFGGLGLVVAFVVERLIDRKERA